MPYHPSVRQRGITIVLVAVCALGFIGGGVFVLLTQQTGPSAQATVTDCPRVGRTAYSCNGTWRTGDGRVVRGAIDGVSSDDVGRTVGVRLSGNRAYTTSPRLPLVLIGLGLTLALLGGLELRNQARRARHP
jgi:hypothetical protein